jgi:hypothetical protein
MKKKKFMLFCLAVLMAMSAIFFTGCQKDETLDVSGTKWKASISDGSDYFRSTLYFESSKSVVFTLDVPDISITETFPYKISGNIITVDTEPVWETDFFFEKIGNSIYWINFTDNDMVLKYVQQ